MGGRMYLGVDPGKDGGFCLVDGSGQIVSMWEMPIAGGQPCPVGIAKIYHTIGEITQSPKIYIEQIFTMP